MSGNGFEFKRSDLLEAVSDNRNLYLKSFKEKVDSAKHTDFVNYYYDQAFYQIKGQYDLLLSLRIIDCLTYCNLCDQLKDELKEVVKSFREEK